MVGVKICGIRDAASLNVAINGGADWLGFVYFQPSPRHLELADMTPLLDQSAGRVQRVAVTVDAKNDVLDSLVTLGIDCLQLHGNESPLRVEELKKRLGLPLMKAISVRDKADLEKISTYEAADYILLDAPVLSRDQRPGGLGRCFDWSLLSGLAMQEKWFLSGGLTAETVTEAIHITGCRNVDVSSGIETKSGQKDHDLMRAFLKRVKGLKDETK